MPAARTLLRVAGPVGGLAALHGVLVAGREDLALPVMAAAMGFNAVVSLATGGSRGERLGFAAVALVLVALQVVMLAGWEVAFRAVVLPPLFMNAWLAYYFGRTLVPGRQPLITRISALSRGSMPDELIPYTRLLTQVWMSYFIAMTVVAFLAGILADPALWSWLVIVGGPGGAAVMFLAEHGYRAVRFRHLGHNSPLRTLGIMVRPDTWMPG